jgi:flagellar motor switch protein FliN/FliY
MNPPSTTQITPVTPVTSSQPSRATAESSSQLGSAAREYVDLWLKHISQAFTRIVGTSVSVDAAQGGRTATESVAPAAPGFWVRLFGGKAGEQAFFLSPADGLRFSQLLSGSPAGDAATPTVIDRESIVEFFQQIATMIPAADWLGFSCELEASATDRIEWEGAWQDDFRFFPEQSPLLVLHAALSADFASAIERTRGTVAPTPEPSEAFVPNAPSALIRDSNLDLLMDIELEVTLRFGQREMSLKDILNLSPGSVIELEQQVQDPVELLVGGRVIAWGEVVTVEGNYGLRVTGLASREERLQSLRK